MDVNGTGQKKIEIEWHFGLRWVLLTVAGWIIGLPIGIVFVVVVGWDRIMGFPNAALDELVKLGMHNAAFFIVIAAVVGLMQWLALRRVVLRAGFWVLASIIGFTISSIGHGVICYVCGYPDDFGPPLGNLLWAAAFVVGGTLSGMMQYRILRHHVRWSGWWMPASAAGWGLGVIGFGAPFFFLPDNGNLYEQLLRNLVLPPILASVILGIVTGGALIWLLRQPTQQTTAAT